MLMFLVKLILVTAAQMITDSFLSGRLYFLADKPQTTGMLCSLCVKNMAKYKNLFNLKSFINQRRFYLQSLNRAEGIMD